MFCPMRSNSSKKTRLGEGLISICPNADPDIRLRSVFEISNTLIDSTFEFTDAVSLAVIEDSFSS